VATVLLAPVALAVCAVMIVGIVKIGAAASARARADAVADLVALAAVTGGADAAEAVAAANGGRVLDTGGARDVRTAVVEVGGVRSTASAAPADGPAG